MKKTILRLLILLSLSLVGCRSGLETLSVVETMNKELIDDIKEESQDLIASYNNVEFLGAGLNENRGNLELNFQVNQEERQENLEKLSNLIMEKLKTKLEDLNPSVSIAWSYGEGEKLIFYNYSIDENMNILLEETYLEEKILK